MCIRDRAWVDIAGRVGLALGCVHSYRKPDGEGPDRPEETRKLNIASRCQKVFYEPDTGVDRLVSPF